jgi:hypothetical protein
MLGRAPPTSYQKQPAEYQGHACREMPSAFATGSIFLRMGRHLIERISPKV